MVPADAGQVILVNCSQFILQDLTLSMVAVGIQLSFSTDNTVTDTIMTNNLECGICLMNSSENTITNSTISNTDGRGIELYGSSHNHLTRNTISDNDGYGIMLTEKSHYNTLSDNTISYNVGFGLCLSEAANNTITQNRITDNLHGSSRTSGGIVLTSQSENNHIIGNTIANHTAQDQIGLSITSMSLDNTVYHNEFLNNTQNAFDNGANIWDDDYPSGGNFWDDYTGTDSNNDGIGDTPYNISGGVNQDRYPLIQVDALIPDLECDGDLSWTDVKPSEAVTGAFTVRNAGDSGSLLNWEVTSWPDWGTWTFTPSNGDDLTPEAGPVTIEVEVVAPDEEQSTFTGEVKIINKDNSSDYHILQVSLMTPRAKQTVRSLLLRFFERFPRLQSLLKSGSLIDRVLAYFRETSKFHDTSIIMNVY
jgi:parallel beta-helix repeat protein